MARDTTAMTVQGPDNGSGNPLAVTATIAGNQAVNVAQIAGTNTVTAAAGVERVGIADSTNTGINVQAAGDNTGALMTMGTGALGTQATATHATNSITLAASPGKRNRLMWLAVHYTGANTASNVTVADGATTVFLVQLPASTNIPQFYNFGPCGILGTVNTAMTISMPDGGVGIVGVMSIGSVTV